MTFDEAMTAARAGKYVTHPGRGKGWTVGSIPGDSRLKNYLWNHAYPVDTHRH